jgi:hypothetical protein
MAGNQPDSPQTAPSSPRPDRGPPGRPGGRDNTSGYDEKKPTSVSQRDAPDPTVPGNRAAQTGVEPTPQNPDEPDIDQPVPPGDIPSKTPVKEPERDAPQYVGPTKGDDPQAIYSDAARPIVPGPADGAD